MVVVAAVTVVVVVTTIVVIVPHVTKVISPSFREWNSNPPALQEGFLFPTPLSFFTSSTTPVMAPIGEVGKRRERIWLLSQSPMVIRTANHDVGKWRIRIQIDGGRDEVFNPGDQSLLKATPLSTPARQAILTVSQIL
ncbi:MAG: hypothetical protein ACKN81_13265, partial [Pirellulaceae bacterium]